MANGASTTLQLVLEGDASKAVKALERAEKKIEKLERKLKDASTAAKKTGKAAKETGDKFGKAFGGKALGDLKTFALGLVGAGGILAALRLVKAELKAIIDLQAKAASAQLTLNVARQGLIKNMAGLSDEAIQNALNQATEISKASGVDEKFIAKAMAQAISASGQNVPQSVANVAQAAKFIPEDPESLALFAGAFADISKFTKSDDPAVNQGFLQAVGAQARIVNPLQQAINIPRGVSGLIGAGATTQEAGAFFAALTSAGVDPSGEKSATSATGFVVGLREFFSDKKNFKDGLARTIGKDVSFSEAIKVLQEDKDLGDKFIAGLPTEKQFKIPIEQLIKTPDIKSGLNEFFQAAMKLIPTSDEGLANVAAESIRQQTIDPTNRNAVVNRILENTARLMLTENQIAGEKGIAREGVRGIVQATGAGAISQKVLSADFERQVILDKRLGLDTGIDILERRVDQLTTRRVPSISMGVGQFQATDPVSVERSMTTQERFDVEQIKAAIDVMLELKNVGIAQTEALRANTDNLQTGVGIAGANESE